MPAPAFSPTALLLLLPIAAILAVAARAEWTIVGTLLKRSGMPHGRWAVGTVMGLLLAVALGLGLVVARTLGTI